MTLKYVDTVLGDDANNGNAPGAGNAWATIGKSMTSGATGVVAGDHVFIKASGTYVENPDIKAAGSSVAGRIIWEGYTTTPGDGGMVTIDSSGGADGITDTVSGNAYLTLRNLSFNGGSFLGHNCGALQFIWQNCEFNNFGNHGTLSTSGHLYFHCTVSGAALEGLRLAAGGCAWGCVVFGNGQNQILAASAVLVAYCRCWGLASNLFYGGIGNSLSGPSLYYNNTVDGDGVANSVGFRILGSAQQSVIFNCVAMDCSRGFDGQSTPQRRVMVMNSHNAAINNTTDFNNWTAGPGEFSDTVDPFEDSANRDYTPKDGSTLIDAGRDHSDSGSGMDIGAIQRIVTGGGGGASGIPQSLHHILEGVVA